MDSYKQLSGAEGCSSSESGWTMYIASPMQEDDAGCSNDSEENDDFYGGNKKEKQRMKIDDAESDDSMASDASSGPVHGTMASKKDDKDHGSKCSSQKNVATKQEKKRVDSKSKRK